MKPLFPRLLAFAALLAAAPLVFADGEDASPLLERLSAETSGLVARAEAHTVRLTADDSVLVGVLVGEPARLVVALDDVPEHARVPRAGKVVLTDGATVDAQLLDSDGELGLAIYALEGVSAAGLAPAPAAALRRGALAVAGGAGDLGLVLLDRVGGPLDDVSASADAGAALLAPGGRLLGLRPGIGSAGWTAGCAACHQTSVPSVVSLPRLEVSFAGASLPGAPAPGMQPGAYDILRLAGARPTEWQATGGMGYPHDAVPAPVIERALADVASAGRFAHPYLGVVTEERGVPDLAWLGGRLVDAKGRGVLYAYDARGRLLSRSTGERVRAARGSVRLLTVLADSPAAKAGLTKGQEITAVDGQPCDGTRGFARALARRRPGERVRLTVEGLSQPIDVVLGDREKEGRDLASAASVGLEVQTLTPDLVAFLGLAKDTQGVVVRSVVLGSPAAAAGLQRGDVLLDGGNGPIRDAEELDAVLGAAREAVLLGGRRAEQPVTFTLALPPPGAPRKAR